MPQMVVVVKTGKQASFNGLGMNMYWMDYGLID
jgi:hypothetical protein